MVQVLMTHVSDRRNRLSIRMRGLLPRHTADHNYPTFSYQPTGVFAIMYGDAPWFGGTEDKRDLYVIDVAGLPSVKDLVLSKAARVIQTRVTPDRICARLDRDEYNATRRYREQPDTPGKIAARVRNRRLQQERLFT